MQIKLSLTEPEALLVLDLLDGQIEDGSYWGNRKHFIARLESVYDKVIKQLAKTKEK